MPETQLAKLRKDLAAYLTDQPMTGSIAESAAIQQLMLSYYKHREGD